VEQRVEEKKQRRRREANQARGPRNFSSR